MKEKNPYYGKYFAIDYFVDQTDDGELFTPAFGTARRDTSGLEKKQTKYAFYSLHYVHSGRGTIYRGNETFAVEAGDLFLIYPDEMIVHRNDDEGEPWELYWINFRGKKAPSLVERMHFNHDNPVLKGNHEEVYEAFNRTLCGEIPDSVKDLIVMSLLYEIVSIVGKIHGGPVEVKPNFPAYVSNAILYIEQNYSNPELSIHEVAKFCNINANYLSRLFRSSLNVCFSHYLSSVRMQKAKEFLSLKKYKVNEVSELVGYSNPLYFSKEFKKYVGMPPSDYFGNYTKVLGKTTLLQSEK